MLELLPLYPSCTMITAVPGGTLPRRISDYKFKKNFLPTVPRRGSDVAVLFIEDDFHDSGVNRIDSYLFLQSQSIHLFYSDKWCIQSHMIHGFFSLSGSCFPNQEDVSVFSVYADSLKSYHANPFPDIHGSVT